MHIIHIEPSAPAKPALGKPCNGCGVCCLSEPCPLGVLLFQQRKGPCQAILWDATSRAYRCGAMTEPDLLAKRVLPTRLHVVAPVLGFVLRYGARRWIASGIGCDSTLEPVPSNQMTAGPHPYQSSDR